MHKLRALLNKLLKKAAVWNWSNECQKIFEDIKSMLTYELSLTRFNPDLEIILASDVSNYSIRAVICHKFKDGKIKEVTCRWIVQVDPQF